MDLVKNILAFTILLPLLLFLTYNMGRVPSPLRLFVGFVKQGKILMAVITFPLALLWIGIIGFFLYKFINL